MMMEQSASSCPERQHPRVAAGFLVKMRVGTRQVLARARDLSMTGLLVECPVSRLPRTLDVRIPLPGQDREVAATCRLERVGADSVALSFAQIGWSDLIRLARYLSPRL